MANKRKRCPICGKMFHPQGMTPHMKSHEPKRSIPKKQIVIPLGATDTTTTVVVDSLSELQAETLELVVGRATIEEALEVLIRSRYVPVKHLPAVITWREASAKLLEKLEQ